VGLIGGARLGSMIGHVDDAIGLSLIVKHEFGLLDAKYNIPHALTIGAVVLTTITATCIFFEVIGPILTKVALSRAGEIPRDEPNQQMP